MSETHDPHVGSSFDAFLHEDGLRDVVRAQAAKEILALRLETELASRGMTRSALASALGAELQAVNRLFDPEDQEVSVGLIQAAAAELGLTVRIDIR